MVPVSKLSGSTPANQLVEAFNISIYVGCRPVKLVAILIWWGEARCFKMWGNGMSRLLQPPFAALRSWKDVRLRIDWYLIDLMKNCLPINKKTPRGGMLLLQLKTSKLEIAKIDWISEGGHACSVAVLDSDAIHELYREECRLAWWVISLFVASNKMHLHFLTRENTRENRRENTSKNTNENVRSRGRKFTSACNCCCL